MAVEFEIDEKIQEILTGDLRGFKCPVCHHDEFAVFDDLNSPFRTQLLHYDGESFTPLRRTRLISIACTNCGHIEQFAEEPLRRRASAALGASE